MDLADIFDSMNLDDLQEMVVSSRVEDLYLEFKTISDARFQQKEDRKNLAIALSGFANSDGGIIIWGIETRRNSEDVDAASGLRPIPNLDLLLSKLNEHTGSALSPIATGVRHRTIPARGSEGFAATLVPASDSGPHMAKGGGEHRYYKRSGDSFRMMEHFDIADMFGRRRRPELTVKAVVRPGAASNPGSQWAVFEGDIIITIENNGRGTASAPFLDLAIEDSYHLKGRKDLWDASSGRIQRLDFSSTRSHAQFGSEINTVIHPGTAFPAVRVEYQFTSETTPPDLILRYSVAAVDFPLTSGSLHLTGNEIKEQDEGLRAQRRV
jgi:hypothetical protein